MTPVNVHKLHSSVMLDSAVLKCILNVGLLKPLGAGIHRVALSEL